MCGAAQTKPTFQPVSEKILPAEPILTQRSRMPGKRDQRQVPAAVEDHVLPHLVADRDGAGLFAEARQQFEVLAAVDGAGRIERVVEQHHLGLRREGARQHLLGEAPVRRLEPHEARHAAGALHQRQVGVVERLEQHHLVAGLDQRQQRAGERLGGAGGHHDLGLGIEREILPVPVMRGDRLAQFRQAQHRRILVPAVDHRLGRLAPHVLRPGIVGKALAEIDRVVLAREPRHHLEHGDGKVGEDRIHARVRFRSAGRLPSRP